MARGIVFSTERLHSLFEPHSIALVGASEKSTWSLMIHAGLQAGGFEGRVYYVNPRNAIVHGQPTVASLSAIGEPVDLCYIMVGTNAVLPVIHEMIATGIHNGIVLTGGFAEQDEQGRELQDEITRLAAEHDLALIGPNCMGFINLVKHTEAMASLPERPLLPGSVALISQSGALGGVMMNYAHSQNVGLSMLISTGNEATISVTDALQYAVEDEATKVLAVFMETIREPERFIEVARRAFALGKPLVALKAGSSEASTRVAITHTGALTGNDRIIDALFRQLGVVRVDSLEELVLTANVFAQAGQIPGKRLAVVGISGGACDLAADLAEKVHISLPIFTDQTKQALRELLPVLGPANNPLDVTGAAMNNQALMGKLLDVVCSDPQLDAVLCVMSLPANDAPESRFVRSILAGIGQALQNSPVPGFLLDFASNNVSQAGRAFLAETSMPFVGGGIHHVIKAMEKVMSWTQQYRSALQEAKEEAQQAPVLPMHQFSTEPTGSWSEYQARNFLEQAGIPVIPAKLVTTEEQAVEAAREIGLPVALKIASPDIVHKSDIGGVKLNVQTEDEVLSAFLQIMYNAQSLSPQPEIEGILISPMRSSGTELLVGVTHDESWGQILTVGLGGIWVEVLKDTSLRILPASHSDISAMLNELQGKALLSGARGSQAADMESLIEIIYRIGQLAQSLSDRLEALEINPLKIDGARIEALDAVITWQERKKDAHE
jgi:acyl-CoA synthetase (NDP forming)